MTQKKPEEALLPERQFVEWAFEQCTVNGYDIDGGTVQDKLEELGLIESHPVNPDENEWEASELYFLKDTPREALLLNPDMPEQQLRLNMGELSASEVRVARAAIRWANTRFTPRADDELVAKAHKAFDDAYCAGETTYAAVEAAINAIRSGK